MNIASLLTCICLILLGLCLLIIAIGMWTDRRPKRKRAEAEKEYKAYLDMCDACGRHPKQPNSQICAECEEKIYGKR